MARRMTARKPLDPADVVEQAADLAGLQFGVQPTEEQRQVALRHVQSMAARKHSEDTHLVVGLAIGWASAPGIGAGGGPTQAVGPVTVEVTVRLSAEVRVLATSHPGAEDDVDDLIAALQVADHVQIVAAHVVAPYAEPGTLPQTQEDTHG